MTSPLSPRLRLEWLRCTGGVNDWLSSLPGRGVVWLLNFGGTAELDWSDQRTRTIRPGVQYCLRTDSANRLTGARRLADGPHDCLVLYYPDIWLRANLLQLRSNLPEDFRRLLFGPPLDIPLLSRPLAVHDRPWANGLFAPHLCDGARSLLERTRMVDYFLTNAFSPPGPPEVPLTRTQRLSSERVRRVKEVLMARLDEPPQLGELAAAVGINPHHLSRTFSQVEGITLSAWLRRQRIERASRLIASGRCNVSEAAIEVGYQSLSHFSRAFQEEKGVSPSRWVEHLKSDGAGRPHDPNVPLGNG